MNENSDVLSRQEFDRHVRMLRRELVVFAMRQTRNAARAEDVVQESLLRAWNFRDTFTPQEDVDASVRRWLFKIVANTFVNDYSTRKRQAQMLATFQVDSEAIGHGSSYQPDHLSLSDEVTAAIEGLGPEFREVVQLQIIDELSQREAADHAGIPLGTVQSRGYRGLAVLRRTLAHYAETAYGIVDKKPVSLRQAAMPTNFGQPSQGTMVVPPRPPTIRYALYQATLRLLMSPATSLVAIQAVQTDSDTVDNVVGDC